MLRFLRPMLFVLVLALMAVTTAYAQEPAPPADGFPSFDDLRILLFSLGGVSLLATALTNALKVIGWVKDGQAGRFVTGFNVIGLVVLYILKVFAPALDYSALDATAAQAAQFLTALVGLFGAPALSGVWHNVLKRLSLPLVSTSYQAAPARR